MKAAIALIFGTVPAAGILLSAALLGPRAEAQNTFLSPLVELSQPNFSCDDGFNLFGTWPVDNAEEPVVAVNPTDPHNIVAAWVQGPFEDIIAAASFDGGHSWQRVPIPLTVCSGGPNRGAGQPWLSFAPNGDLHAAAVAGTTIQEIFVTKSVDGGLHWSAPILVSGNVGLPAFEPTITADPTNASFAYAMWVETSSAQAHSISGVFTRTTDGGLSWETARAIVQAAPQSFVEFSQILVLPDGTLVDLYELYFQTPEKPITKTLLQLLRSTDRGQTWSAPINAVTMTPLYRPTNGQTLVVVPDTGQFVHDLTNPSFAVDSRNGNLYAVWEDGRFSNFHYNDIVFSMSADRGSTWSAPIRVNQTPLNINPLLNQAFLPVIAVAADGTIGITYYDFRFTDTDYWLVQCHPSSTSAASDPACWGSEVRLTESSFKMEDVVPMVFGTLFIGDYFGLATAGDDFEATFTQLDNQNLTSIFARRVGP